MKWNGRSYRPVAPTFKVYTNNTSRPNSNSTSKPKKLPVWRTVMSVQPETTTPVSSPTPTPSITPSITPSVSVSPSVTPSITPSITPSVSVSPSITPSITPSVSVSPSVTPSITPSASPLPAGWAEANLYLTAVVNGGGVGINSTISGATRTLFNSLVTSGIYNKLDFMYPIIGSNSSGHKFNAINPSDTNGAFRLTFFGGWTHSSTGMKGNGSNAYADTYYQPVTESFMTDSSATIGVYVRDLSASSYPIEMGGTYFGDGCSLSVKMDSATNIIGNLFGGLTQTNFATGAQTGSFIITKTANNSVRVYRRGVLATTLAIGGAVSPPSGNLYVGANNDTTIPGADSYSPRELAFVFGGQGLSAAEVANISTYINTFQTSLGRNVY